MRLGSRPTQRHRETSVAGEVPALCNRTDKRRPEDVERLRGHDQRVASARLLATLRGTQIDVVNVSAIHL
jgi:hypothetical protein